MASSCSRWCVSTQTILPVEASGPGNSPRSSLVTARAQVYFIASVSIHSVASLFRSFYLLYFSQPATDRALFRAVRARPIRSIVELGISLDPNNPAGAVTTQFTPSKKR